jgi:TfoX/Sxy family transcriptional regulator of competence genes
MASDAGYAEYVCDQLAAVGNVSVRRMFGEYALKSRNLPKQK